VGYNVRGPVVLLGTPATNPLVKFLADQQVLPVAVTPQMPGPGRALIAWQTGLLGPAIESIALIADDEAGWIEAVGGIYEAAAGMDPLTRWELPATTAVAP
jgi:hypothetical protein